MVWEMATRSANSGGETHQFEGSARESPALFHPHPPRGAARARPWHPHRHRPAGRRPPQLVRLPTSAARHRPLLVRRLRVGRRDGLLCRPDVGLATQGQRLGRSASQGTLRETVEYEPARTRLGPGDGEELAELAWALTSTGANPAPAVGAAMEHFVRLRTIDGSAQRSRETVRWAAVTAAHPSAATEFARLETAATAYAGPYALGLIWDKRPTASDLTGRVRAEVRSASGQLVPGVRVRVVGDGLSPSSGQITPPAPPGSPRSTSPFPPRPPRCPAAASRWPRTDWLAPDHASSSRSNGASNACWSGRRPWRSTPRPPLI